MMVNYLNCIKITTAISITVVMYMVQFGYSSMKEFSIANQSTWSYNLSVTKYFRLQCLTL